jgi:uncharacterized membrane protein
MTSDTERGARTGGRGRRRAGAVLGSGPIGPARPLTGTMLGTVLGSGPIGPARPLVRSVLAGMATGARSSVGLAALTMAASPSADTWPDRWLVRPWAKATAGLAAATEITLDKLPNTPSRLAPPGLASRVVGGAASGFVIARREAQVASASEAGVVAEAEVVAGAGVAAEPGAGVAAEAGVEVEAGAGATPAGGDGTWAWAKPESLGEPALGGPALVATCVAIGAGSAVGACWLGAQWRSAASARLGRDWIGAVIEDVVAISLAAAAAAIQ